jgi:hypothetical protein
MTFGRPSLTVKDPGRFALKNAVRAAIVVPAGLAVGHEVFGSGQMGRWEPSAASVCSSSSTSAAANGSGPRLPVSGPARWGDDLARDAVLAPAVVAWP